MEESIARCNGEGCKLKYACRRYWYWRSDQTSGVNAGIVIPPKFDGLSMKCPDFVTRYKMNKNERLGGKS